MATRARPSSAYGGGLDAPADRRVLAATSKAPASAPPLGLRSPQDFLRLPLERGPPPANGHAARLAPSGAPPAAPCKPSRAPPAGSAYPGREPSGTPRDARPRECGRGIIGRGGGAGAPPGTWDEPGPADAPPYPEERGQPSGTWPGEGEDASEQVDEGVDFDPWAIIDDPLDEDDAPVGSPGEGGVDEETLADSDVGSFEDVDAEWAADAADGDAEDGGDPEAAGPDAEGREPADGGQPADEELPAREGDLSLDEIPEEQREAVEGNLELKRALSLNPSHAPGPAHKRLRTEGGAAPAPGVASATASRLARQWRLDRDSTATYVLRMADQDDGPRAQPHQAGQQSQRRAGTLPATGEMANTRVILKKCRGTPAECRGFGLKASTRWSRV